MSRFSHYDTDEERLPEGMQRVGYDADTQVYTFIDAADGSYWESAPGCQYGQLSRVGATEPPPYEEDSTVGSTPPKMSWRHELGPLLNFGMIIGLFLILLFWFLHWSTDDTAAAGTTVCGDGRSYAVSSGDTCWGVAERGGIELDELLRANEGLDCDALQVGTQICVPGRGAWDA